MWDFQVLKSKFITFLMPILKWQVNSSSNFASFFIFMAHNCSVDFKLILFLLWITGSHQNPNFEIFDCSSENLPYSCHFQTTSFSSNFASPSVSWEITPLYFFRSNVILCTFFVAIILTFFVCSYCRKLFVINYFTLFLKWCIVYLVFYPVLMLHV